MLPPAELLELFFAVLKDFFNALLVSAGLFLTVFTPQALICSVIETFGITVIKVFPN